MHLADAAAAAAEARLEFGVSPPLPRGATINMQRSVELAELLENMAIDGDVERNSEKGAFGVENPNNTEAMEAHV